MGMKEGRDQRRDELIKQFVSVENLIEQLSKETGLGIDEVAAEFMQMHQKAGDSDLPVFGSIDESFFRFRGLENAHQHREILYEMLDETIDGFGHGDRSDHFGWMNDGLIPFLRKIGCDVPIEIPSWQPQEMHGPITNTDHHTKIDRSDDSFGGCEFIDHPLFPEELSIAISAWNAAVVQSEREQMRPGAFIRKWLSDNNPGLTKEAIIRIGTIANWEKNPGRAKSNR
ncbi:MAG: hypothetical protein KKE51_08190 [Gammaproteobacteria bacterium]|nr:hypothetical protein [Gammaproteobacteria bacterium]MBU1602371.1 hypothetical protein [Gammaproteobacteria bacterium]MBU2433177.1 hypothetical protein [Gammaproteobacteria bacterium]MBU2451092.1 hypothetical protein [Gammaproteobacteria bacterium]